MSSPFEGEAESLQDVKDRLRAKRVVLWPDVAFDLTDERELRSAAEWLVEAAGSVGLLPHLSRVISSVTEEVAGCRVSMRDSKPTASATPAQEVSSSTPGAPESAASLGAWAQSPRVRCPECKRKVEARHMTPYGTCYRCRVVGASFSKRGLRDSQL